MKFIVLSLFLGLNSCSFSGLHPENPYDQWAGIIANLQNRLNVTKIECSPALLEGHESDRELCFDLREGDSNDSRDRGRIVEKVAQAVQESLPRNFVQDRGWMLDYGQYSATWKVRGKPEWGLLVMHRGHNSAKRTTYHPRHWKDGKTPPVLQGDFLMIGLFFDEWYKERQDFIRRNP